MGFRGASGFGDSSAFGFTLRSRTESGFDTGRFLLLGGCRADFRAMGLLVGSAFACWPRMVLPGFFPSPLPPLRGTAEAELLSRVPEEVTWVDCVHFGQTSLLVRLTGRTEREARQWGQRNRILPGAVDGMAESFFPS